jgi:hypothetical protein
VNSEISTEESSKETSSEISVEESSKEDSSEISVEESSKEDSSEISAEESSKEDSSEEKEHEHAYALTKPNGVWLYQCTGCDFTTPLLSTEENGEFVEGVIDFAVELDEGRDPVVLQLSDTQFTNWGNPENWCYAYLRETIIATNPDLILVTGDNVYGRFDENGSYHTSFIEFMESFQIPWAPVFGNHDNECALGVDWQCQQYENAEYCLFKQRDLTGNGNYSIGLLQDNELLRVFYMLDSNGCANPMIDGAGNKITPAAGTNVVKTTAGFGQDQVDWYTASITQLKTFTSDVKISFAYHIPQSIFDNAIEKYKDEIAAAGSLSEKCFNLDDCETADETDFGCIGFDSCGSWDADHTIWNGMKELGVDSIFVGHEHCNSWSIVYDGIRLQFGQKSSEYDSFNFVFPQDGTIKHGYKDAKPDEANSLIGGTVIIVSKEDGSIPNAYIHYSGDPFTYKPLSNVLQGDNRNDMPLYLGAVTDLGFAEGTVVYEVTNETSSLWDDCWTKRAILKAPATQDYVTVEFVPEKDIEFGKLIFHTWGVKGSPSLYTIDASTRTGGCITTMEGYEATILKAGKHYLLHVACAGLSEIQIGSLTFGSAVYFANITFNNGSLPTPTTNPNPEPEPEVPDVTELFVYQGDSRNTMPTYNGNATALGFAEGTTPVYELVTTADDGWTPRSVIEVNCKKDYLAFDVVFSKDINANLTLWPAGNNTMYGSYALSVNGVIPSNTADNTRKVFILNQNGEQATSFKGNTLYTIYFYLTGQEQSVHFGSWVDATIYFANIRCEDGDIGPEAPFIPNVFTQDGADVLPLYEGDVTEFGFEKDTDVVVKTTTNSTWSDGVYIYTVAATNCLTIKFSLSVIPSEGQQFMIYGWGNDNDGYIARINDCKIIHNSSDTFIRKAELLNADGSVVTKWETNKVYTLKIYHNGLNSISILPVSTAIPAGSSIYFDNSIIQNNDEYIAKTEN